MSEQHPAATDASSSSRAGPASGGALLWRAAKPLLRVTITAVVASWLVISLLLWAMQERMIFPATKGEPQTLPNEWNLPFQRHALTTDDGESIDVWWLPQPDIQAPVVIFCHGNAGNLGHRLQTLRALHMAGLAVIAFDYRGYGVSTGRPSEVGLYRDADRVWKFATDELDLDPQQIILHGRSLGGGVAAYMAERYPAAGLILESTFTSLVDVARGQLPFLPVRLLARHHFPTLERLENIDSPILILHGRGDITIPYHHGETLYAALAGRDQAQMVTLDGGHNDGWVDQSDLWLQSIRDFVARISISVAADSAEN